MKKNTKSFETVADVVRSDLCTGCGMCEVVCPVEAIEVLYNPLFFHNTAKVDNAKCIKCKRCLQVCSGWYTDHSLLSKCKFGKLPENPFLGNYEKILSAWSENNSIRKSGASGGFVTQLLLNLLEKGIIDAALIVRPGESDPLIPEVFLATSKQDVLKGQRSCYLNASVCRGLKEVLEKKLRIGLVALPCQINSLLKSSELLPELKKQIVFTIGLFCNGVFTQKSIHDYCQIHNIDQDKIERIDFRWGAWPGKMRLLLKNGREILAKRDDNFKINYMRRCYFCYDSLADKADISVGDNWGDEDKSGKNIIIVRNSEILEYFENITTENFAASDLFETHRVYHSRRRYAEATSKIAFLSRCRYPQIIPYKKFSNKLWRLIAAWFDWRIFHFDTRTVSFKARLLLKLRGFYFSHFVYTQPIPEKYVSAEIKNKPTVLITEGDLKGNKGAVAMVHCIIRDLQKSFPEIVFIVTSKQITRNIHIEDNLRILYIKDPVYDMALLRTGLWWLLKKIGISFDILLKHNIIESYLKADIIISATGISFIDDFGYRKVFHYARYVLLPLLLGKRVIKFTQSFGPIKSKYNRLMASALLPLTEIVMARGKHSAENLSNAGIKENVFKYPDIAITLEPEMTPRVAEETFSRKFIGISPNVICQKLAGSAYLKTMHSLVRFIAKAMPELPILFIPHTISELRLANEDDLSLCRELAKSLDCSYKIADTIKMSPGELKALIGECEFFVGSRYHSLVAAVSMAIPCLAIGWHWKYNELMDWYEITDNIVNIWDLEKLDITERFKTLFENRTLRKKYLSEKNIEIEELASRATRQIITKLQK